MAFDGSLKYDTKVNTDGFEKGISTLNRASEACAKTAESAGRRMNEAFNKSTQISSLENQIEQTEQKIRDLFAAMEEMKGTDVPTEEYQELSKLVEKTQLKLEGLLERQNKLDEQGIRKNSSRWKSLQYDIDETTRRLETYKTELQDTVDRDRAFTSGQDSSAYTKKAEALENLNNKLYVQKQRLSELISKEGSAAVEAARLSDIAKNAVVSNQEIADLNRQLQELTARQKELQAAGVGYGHAEYDSNAVAISDLTARIKEYKSSLSGASDNTSKFSTYMEMAAASGRKLLGAVLKLGGSGFKRLGTLAKKAASGLMDMGKAFLFGNKQMGSYNRGMGGILRKMILFSVIRKIISGITSAFKEGIQNYAQYSSSFNSIMSSFVSTLDQLKNSVAAAFSPITAIVVPILDILAQKLIYVINLIGQFLAAITGKGTFSKAVKVNKDYTESVKKTGSAAKKAGEDAKKALAPFDDLMQMQQQSNASGSGTGGVDPSQMFTEENIDQGISDFANRILEAFKAGDFAAIGRIIGEKINESVQKFTGFISWENVGGKITAFVTTFTTLFNNLVATIKWYEIGEMFGTGINTIIHTLYLFLDGIDWGLLGKSLGKGINGLVDKVEWELFGRTLGAYFKAKIEFLLEAVEEVRWGKIGDALGDLIMNMIREIPWEKVGLLFAETLNGAIETVQNLASTIQWEELGSSLADSLSTFFQKFDWAGAGTAVSDIVIGLLDALIVFVEKTDWSEFGEGVATSLARIDWPTIINRMYAVIGATLGGFAAFLGGLIAVGAEGAKEYFQKEVEDCGGNIVLGVFKGILKVWSSIPEWIYENMQKPFVKGFAKAFGTESNSSILEQFGESLFKGFSKGIIANFINPTGTLIRPHIVEPFINGIKTLLGIHSPSTVMEEMGGYTIDGFNQGVTNGQSSTQSVVQSWASGVASWFASKLGISTGDSAEAQKWASSTMSGFNNSVSTNYKNSQSVMETWADNVRKWFVASGDSKGINQESWKKFADDIIKAFKETISSKNIDTQEPVETWAENIRKWFVGTDEKQGINEASWTKFADDIIKAFKEKIESGHGDTRSPLETWAKNVREWFWGDSNPEGTGGLYGAFYNMAKRINEGFSNGISDFAYMAKDAIRKWAQDVMDEAEKEFDIHSPSKEFHTIAEYVVKGFNNGLADLASSSVNAAQNWLDDVLDVFKGVDIEVPVGLNIPNASSYLPRMATGSIVPPRAGETAALMKSGGYGQEEALGYLLTKIDEMMGNMQGGDERPIQLVLNLSGDLAALARVLKPELDEAAKIKGVSLVVTGGT